MTPLPPALLDYPSTFLWNEEFFYWSEEPFSKNNLIIFFVLNNNFLIFQIFRVKYFDHIFRASALRLVRHEVYAIKSEMEIKWKFTCAEKSFMKYSITNQNFFKSKLPLFHVFLWIAWVQFSKHNIFMLIKQQWYLIRITVPQIDFISY